MKKKEIFYKIIYIIFNTIVVGILISKLISRDYYGILFCMISLILFLLPNVISKAFNLIIPVHLKIFILLFVFSSQVFGEVYHLYVTFPCYDIILHVLGGFYISSLGFSLIFLLDKKRNFNKVLVCLFIFSFSMTVGVLWEFFEYSIDKVLGKNMQKDTAVNSIITNYRYIDVPVKLYNIDHTILYNKYGKEIYYIKDGYLDIGLSDTISDLFSNLVGAFLFTTLSYLYFNDRKKYSLVGRFIIKEKTT